MAIYPIEFCPHLVRAIISDKKTLTIKAFSNSETSNSPRYAVNNGLWVQEIWGVEKDETIYLADSVADCYNTDSRIKLSNWHPAQDMTIDKARIRLVVTGISAIRLNSVTEEMAVASGMLSVGKTALEEFKKEWDDMYMSPRRWKNNPECWKIEFRKSLV
jgi:uncharacterized protein YqfB (UPF0267 family)